VVADETANPPITRCTGNYAHVGANDSISAVHVIGDQGVYSLPTVSALIQAVIDESGGSHPDFTDTCIDSATVMDETGVTPTPRAVVAGDVVPITFDIPHGAYVPPGD
jgi:hypothetical protein